MLRSLSHSLFARFRIGRIKPGGPGMATTRSWAAYPLSYRAKDLQTLVGRIQAGQNGSIVGPNGIGKSNLLGFVRQRPEALQPYLSNRPGRAALVLVDLNNLPADDLSSPLVIKPTAW
jgi:hypothetical protein